MARPTFIIVEPDPGAALSTRKLVIETAKFNVLTAHTANEGVELFRQFPAVDAMIVTLSIGEQAAANVLKTVKGIDAGKTTICISPTPAKVPNGADHHTPSFDPEKLVALLRTLFGDPRVQQP